MLSMGWLPHYSIVHCRRRTRLRTLGRIRDRQVPQPFVEAGRSSQEVTGRISVAFQQLFHGDRARRQCISRRGKLERPAGLYYDINSRDVRSEGMSYA